LPSNSKTLHWLLLSVRTALFAVKLETAVSTANEFGSYWETDVAAEIEPQRQTPSIKTASKSTIATLREDIGR
jgi:hypothetical protein